MDGMNYFRNPASEPASDVAPLRTIARGLTLTVVAVALTLGVLLSLRMAGTAPLFTDEMVVAPIAW